MTIQIKLKKNKLFRHNFTAWSIIVFAAIVFWLSLPSKLFKNPLCTVITDKENNLIGASIASDGQYRFPEIKHLPEKYKTALIHFEDKRFYNHPGFDILSLIRAIKQNYKSGQIKSGASTIPMQVIRLSRKNRERTYTEKFIEIFLAFRLQFSYSKNEILNLYASNAPFGGNIVGFEAAVWRYFGINPENITWAQAALLAVLPNSPSLIHPGKNRELLLKKRNNLLRSLYKSNIITKQELELSLDEPVPEKPNKFPDLAQHLLFRVKSENKNGGFFRTTVNKNLQNDVTEIVEKHHNILKGNGINNIAAIIIETETGNVSAYIGNSNTQNNGEDVDLINSVRSSGSILKPLLYASMLSSGDILQQSLVFDIPTYIGGYSPKNFGKDFEGAISADKALSRSLNIPAVRMLRQYGVDKFYFDLEKIGISSLHGGPSHYGLSLILGGAEVSLWEITGVYASLARVLLNFEKFGGKYRQSDYRMPNLYFDKAAESAEKYQIWKDFDNSGYIDAASLWFTFEALTQLDRPGIESSWESYNSSQKIAWKTGTSIGFKDAWAIGITPKYVVGVWVGNADGEGRPGLIGAAVAGPVMFDIFKILPKSQKWFVKPLSEMITAEICSESGYLAGEFCNERKKTFIPKNGILTDKCPFHHKYHFNKDLTFRVNNDCENSENIIEKNWFVLPPSVEIYYKSKNASYKFLPPLRSDCSDSEISETSDLEIIYPYENSKIYVPVYLDGQAGTTVFQAVHRNREIELFWYLNDKLVGKTKYKHEIELRPKQGKYKLSVIDQNGTSVTCNFEILNEN